MLRIVEIVPAPPGWYARWRLSSQQTVSYPVAVWGLVEDVDKPPDRKLVGIDASGQWQGSADNEFDALFLRFVYAPPDTVQPDDAVNPLNNPIE
jgi:hypothetical protein